MGHPSTMSHSVGNDLFEVYYVKKKKRPLRFTYKKKSPFKQYKLYLTVIRQDQPSDGLMYHAKLVKIHIIYSIEKRSKQK